MIRLQFSITLSYEVIGQPADFIFNIHAAPTARQSVLTESLTISQPVTSIIYEDPLLHHRLLRLRANPGPLKISYQADVVIRHHVGKPAADLGVWPTGLLSVQERVQPRVGCC